MKKPTRTELEREEMPADRREKAGSSAFDATSILHGAISKGSLSAVTTKTFHVVGTKYREQLGESCPF